MAFLSGWSKHPRSQRVWRQQAVLWIVLTIADAISAATTHGVLMAFWTVFAILFAALTVISVRNSRRARPRC